MRHLTSLSLTMMLCFCAYLHTLYADDATPDGNAVEAITEAEAITEENVSPEGLSLQTTVEEDFRAWESQFNQGEESQKFIEERGPSRCASWGTAAEQGMPEAQLLYGYCFHYGVGVAKDSVESIQWIRKAAEQDLAAAQCVLGIDYAADDSERKDAAEAVKWFRKAAEQGCARAQYYLGGCYHTGLGVSKDHVEAIQWTRKAAEQGHVGAQNALGNWYANGIGVRKDPVEAAKWFRKSAEQLASQISKNMNF